MSDKGAILSIDFEDFAHDLKRDLGLWKTGPLRGDALWRCYEDIDGFLSRHKARATFFCTGIIAEHLPDLIARIAGDGHEVACHYYFHDEMQHQAPARIERNLQRAQDVLQTAAGSPVIGFRAPKFRIDKTAPAQYRAVERHFLYDSSLCVGNRAAVGEFAARMRLQTLRLLPIFAARPLPGFARLKLGGSYVKLFPMGVTEHMIRKCRAAGMLPHVYLHPYEFAQAGEFRLSGAERAPLGARSSAYWGLRQHQWHTLGNRSLPARLDALFNRLGLRGRLRDLVAQHGVPPPRPAAAGASREPGGGAETGI